MGDLIRQPQTTESELQRLLSRRQLLKQAGVSGSLAFLYLSLPAPARAALMAPAQPVVAGALTPARRHTLQALWDAVVPGTWNGVVEDYLEDGRTPAPGATDAKVQEWLELVGGTLPDWLEWLTESFLALWAEDIDLWADFTEWPWLDDEPDYADLPLASCVDGRKQVGRQSKIILMQKLFYTIVDLKYQAGIIIVRTAFFCDFWNEAQEPWKRVGRKYIGFPLPPGKRPYMGFTYNRVLGDHDPHLIEVNPTRHLVAMS